MSVNVKSMFFTCKCALPLMVDQGRRCNREHLLPGRHSLDWLQLQPFYVSKAAVINFTRGVAIDRIPGIRANSILSGLMDTPHIYQQITTFYASVKWCRPAQALPHGQVVGWDVANAAVFLASDDAAYINGIELPVDGGLHAKAGV